MAKRSLDRATYNAIVKALRAKTPRAAIAEARGVPAFVVGKVAAAAGIGKIKAAVRRKDKEIVAGWLANAAPARRRSRKPAA